MRLDHQVEQQANPKLHFAKFRIYFFVPNNVGLPLAIRFVILSSFSEFEIDVSFII